MNNRNRQLLAKIFIGFISVVVVLVLSIGSVLVWATDSIIHHSYMEKSTLIAKRLLENLDVEKFEQLAKNPEEGELYYELQHQLTETLNVSPITYIYVAVPPKPGEDLGLALVDAGDLDSEDVYHIGEEIDGLHYNQILKKLNEAGSFSEYDEVEGIGNVISSYVPLKNKNGEIFAILGVDDDLDSIEEVQKDALHDIMPIFITITIAVSILIMAVIGVILYRLLLPIPFIRESLFKLDEGDLIESERIMEGVNLKRKNSIALLARVFKNTLETLANMIGKIHQTNNEVKETMANVSHVTSTIDSSTNDLLGSIEEISESVNRQDELSNEMLQAMEQMTANITNVTAQVQKAATDLAKTSKLIFESANEAKDVSNEVQKTSDEVKETSQNVHYLTERYKDIESMVTIIQEIADQTNLPALNASIEAARAGEHGKGFAVVADEVKKLAEITKQSTEEISKTINEFKSITLNVLNEMNANTEKVTFGANKVKSISELLIDVQSETEKVLKDVQSIEEITKQMVETAEDVSETIKQSNNASRQVVESTATVKKAADAQEEIVLKLKESTEHLLSNVQMFEDILNKYQV